MLGPATRRGRRPASPFSLRGVFQPAAFDSLDPRVELFRGETDTAVVYNLLTPSRGYSLNLAKPFVLTEEEAIKILMSLPAD